MRRPWATFWLATGSLAAGLLLPPSVTGQLGTLAPAGVPHTLLVALGLVVAGFGYEPRFGQVRTAIVAAAGLLPGLAFDDAISGAAMALFGGWLLDLARRGENRSLFGPLVAPILLHGALEAATGAQLGIPHGIAFAAGALLTRVLPTAPRIAPSE